MMDFLLRASDRATFLAAAQAHGLMELDAAGALHPARGVHIDEIGVFELAPAILSEDGMNVVAAPVIDPRWHVNMRVTEPALSVRTESGDLKWRVLRRAWMAAPAGTPNAGEASHDLGGVELILGVTTPARVWL